MRQNILHTRLPCPSAQEYAALPTFIRGQLPLKQVNEVLAAVHAAAAERAGAGGAAGVLAQAAPAPLPLLAAQRYCTRVSTKKGLRSPKPRSPSVIPGD